MAERLVEMVVESVRVHMPSSRHVVILKESGRERYLPIWIGPWEASAIAMKLQGLTPERPLTHDLFASTLEELGVRIDQVVIAALAEETFHARLFLETNGRTLEVDSRPSDALALAVRSGVRIFASEEVLAQAGLGPDEDDETGEGGEPLERLSGPSSDPRLAVFRDFVNSLEVDPEGEQREGPGPEGTRPPERPWRRWRLRALAHALRVRSLVVLAPALPWTPIRSPSAGGSVGREHGFAADVGLAGGGPHAQAEAPEVLHCAPDDRRLRAGR